MGGLSGSELRPLGGLTDLDPDGYNVLALYASPRHPDPVVILVSDPGAALADHRPVRARDVLWLLALEFNPISVRSWFVNRGASGDHHVVDVGLSHLALPSLSSDAPRRWHCNTLDHLKYDLGVSKTKPLAPMRRWYLETLQLREPAAALAERIEAAFPGFKWEVREKGAFVSSSDEQCDVRLRLEPSRKTLPASKHVLGDKIVTEISLGWSSDAVPVEAAAMMQLARDLEVRRAQISVPVEKTAVKKTPTKKTVKKSAK